MRKLSHTQAVLHNQEQNTEDSTQHWRASKTKKPKTPARLPPCWQREFTSSNTRQPPKGRFPVFAVAKQRFTRRFIWTLLSNVKTRRKACCPPTDCWWRVCLHRASELASPLTRAAKPKRSLITLERSLWVFWQFTASSELSFNTPNTASKWLTVPDTDRAKLCFLAAQQIMVLPVVLTATISWIARLLAGRLHSEGALTAPYESDFNSLKQGKNNNKNSIWTNRIHRQWSY